MKNIASFTLISAVAGISYFRYYEYCRVNQQIDTLMKENKLEKFLYDFNQDSAFSIDDTMDSYQMRFNQFTINNYRATLAKQCEGEILETCAGSNRNLKFYKPGSKLTLIDWSPNMASVGMTKTLPATQYKYIVADVTKMPFKDDEFDSVIDTFGLEYVLNTEKALQEIRRVCKKGGKIVLMNEGPSSIAEFYYWEKIKWGYNLMRGGYFSNRNWEKILSQFDFEVLHHERKKNGNIHIYVLQNVKNPVKTEEIDKSNAEKQSKLSQSS